MVCSKLFVVLAVIVCQAYSQRIRAPAVNTPISNAAQFKCTEKFARYPSVNQCDAYIECAGGIAQEKLCPDGLFFKPDLSFKTYPCLYPADVDCTGRGQIQPALSSKECPHQNGYYRIADSTNCGAYRSCVHGVSYSLYCPEGLAFNTNTNRCDWPDAVSDCNAEGLPAVTFQTSDTVPYNISIADKAPGVDTPEFIGFRCPAVTYEKSRPNEEPATRYYKSDLDCRKYFACVHEKPRLLTCPPGQGFSDVTNNCELIEEVLRCPENLRKFFDEEKKTLLL